jgi:hypothetical protein
MRSSSFVLRRDGEFELASSFLHKTVSSTENCRSTFCLLFFHNLNIGLAAKERVLDNGSSTLLSSVSGLHIGYMFGG